MNELFFVNADGSVSRICGIASIATDVSTEAKYTDAASVIDLLEAKNGRLRPSRVTFVAEGLVTGETQIAIQDQIGQRKNLFVIALSDGVGDPTVANKGRSKLYFSGTFDSLGRRLTEKGGVSVISCKVGNGQQNISLQDNYCAVKK